MAGAADPKENEGKVPETAPADTSGSPPQGYSIEEWAGLSETEREGIKDSIDNPEVGGEEDITAPEIDKEALKAIVAEGEKPPEKTVPDGASVKPPAAVKPASEAAAPAPAAEGAVPEVPPAAAPTPAPAAEEPVVVSDEDLLSYRPPESALAVKLPNIVPPEIKAKLDALDAKYDAGDVELREYNRERDELNREITETNLQARDELRANAVWTSEQAAFLAARPEYLDKGPEGKAFTERAEMLYGAFGKAVSRIGADPKYANAPGMKILIAADKAVRGAFGIPAPGKKAAAPAVAVVEDKGKPPATKPDVKTLADVPAAAANLTDDGFAAIDKLTGEAYEAALERMTQEQRDAYAARA
jgi:hypothetical protein